MRSFPVAFLTNDILKVAHGGIELSGENPCVVSLHAYPIRHGTTHVEATLPKMDHLKVTILCNQIS